MCLIAVAWRATDRFPLVLAANRDEFHDRPSAPANWWPEPSGVLGGLDLRAGGSWLAVDKLGRLAAVTNVRGDHSVPPESRSRGHLVREFLAQPRDPPRYLEQLQTHAGDYAPFNLLLAGDDRLAYYSSGGSDHRNLGPGIYGLSNAQLDTPWPKVNKLKAALRRALDEKDPADTLFQVLTDSRTADDHVLPDTGVGTALERRLSAPFIRSADYGTRCSTVIVQRADGELRFSERRFDAHGQQVGGSDFGFRLA